jgi:hypothetical protein
MRAVYFSEILEFLLPSSFRGEMSRMRKCSNYVWRKSFGSKEGGEGVDVQFMPIRMVFTNTLAMQPFATQCKFQESGTNITAVILGS